MFSEMIERFSARDDFSALLYRPSHIAGAPPIGRNSRLAHWMGIPQFAARYKLSRKLYHGLSRAYWLCHKSDIYHPTFYPADAELLDRKCVINIYDLTHEEIELADIMPNHEQFLALKRRAVEHADRIVCISEATRSSFLKHYPVDPGIVRVVPLGVSPAFKRHPSKKPLPGANEIGPDGKPFLLYVGSRQRYKNYHRLLQAYQTWERNQDIDLVVVGGKPTAADQALHDITPGLGTVRYVSSPSDEMLCALYNRAEGFVYPSLSEGFGIPLLEAMASGCPLCISDIPVFHEVADDAATYFDPYSVEAIRNALDTCLKTGRTAQLEACQRHRLALFSWDRCADSMWDVYQELL